MVPSIEHFLEADVSDLDLPLLPVVENHIIIGFKRRDALDSDMEGLPCFNERWSFFILDSFQKYQWMMLAPYFSHGKDSEANHYILQDDHILPFIDYFKAAEIYGGFSKVIMVDIHPDHYNFQDAEQYQGGFAIKQLYAEDREAFDRERSILKRFSGTRRHPHIISLLATYEQHSKFHLMFYQAEGDLFRIWGEVIRKPNITHESILWVASQFAGITDGLLHFHKHFIFLQRKHLADQEHPNAAALMRSESMRSEPMRSVDTNDFPTLIYRHEDPFLVNTDKEQILERFGRHGDIDPGNILWYSGKNSEIQDLQGTLKIADFGQARLNSRLSKTTNSPVANKLTYRPPECDIFPRRITQSYEIWSLGCVFLEFTTWILGGADLLHHFAMVRSTPDVMSSDIVTDQFFKLEPNGYSFGAHVKLEVTTFINDLHHHENCTDFIHDLLNLIQLDMLLADPTDRKSCDQIKKKLDDLCLKCKNLDYACGKTPWVSGISLKSAGQHYYLEKGVVPVPP